MSRFSLNPGSLRAVLAHARAADTIEIQPEGTARGRVLTEMRHPVLWSVGLGAELPADRDESGPILGAPDATILRDRDDPKLLWVKTVSEIPDPAELDNPVFHADTVGPGIDGQDLWSATFTLPVRQIRSLATIDQIRQLRASDPTLRFQDLPTILREATLKLPYHTDQGPRIMTLVGRVHAGGGSITFTLKGDAVPLAWKHLTETDQACVELLSEYNAYEPVVINLPHPSVAVVGRQPRPVLLRSGSGRPILPALAPPPTPKGDAANGVNKIRERTLAQREALLRNYRTTPAASTRHARQRIVMRVVQPVSLPRPANARHFTMGDPAVCIVDPPWTRVNAPIREFERVDGNGLGLDSAVASRLMIYASVVDIGCYIVVPDTYVLAREPHTGRLQFDAEVISDPVHPEHCAVRISLGLEPELSPAEEISLRSALETHLAAAAFPGKAPPELRISFPTELGALPELIWSDPLTHATDPVIDGRTILLSLSSVSLGFAAATFKTLMRRGGTLAGLLKFALPNDIVVQSSILVGLTRTTGPSVRVEAVVGALQLSELAGYPQEVTRVISRAAHGAVDSLPLPTPVQLEAGTQIALNSAPAADRTWVADARIIFPEVVEIDPTRIHVDEMVTPLIVTASLARGALFEGGRALQSLQVVVAIAEERVAVAMVAGVNSDAFAPQIINLTVPLTRALAPGGRLLKWQVTAQFDDGSSQTSAWLEQDYALNPDLTITRDVLV